MNEIRVLMVDDHSLFRESLSRLLQSKGGIHVVGECASVAEAVAAISQTEIDVVLLDYDLGEELGVSLLSDLRCCQIEAKVLVVTAGMSDAATRQMLEAGVLGIFFKHSNPDQLVSAINRVAGGEFWLDNGTVRALVAGKSNQAESVVRARPLTARQSEVMKGMIDGLTNKEIALLLKTSEGSVKAIVRELFRKAGARTRSQLVRIAIEKHSSDWLRPQTGGLR
jgi:two-component system, NarL family, nitrate/nitrite response regulator NarL